MAKHKSKSHILIYILGLLIVVGMVNAALIFESRPVEVNDNQDDVLDDIGITPIDNPPQGDFFKPGADFKKQNVLKVDGDVITIGVDCQAIVAATSQERADAINSALQDAIPDRPNVYDGWAAMLDRYDIEFEALAMSSVLTYSYAARAYFVFQGNVLDLDMKPSDGMALALRTDTPIYINMSLLEENGQDIC